VPSQPEVGAPRGGGAAARPWLAHYPPGVPAEIDEGRIGTLVDLLRAAAARHGNRPALDSFGATLNYAALTGAADAVASWLQKQGLAKGDRVAIMLPNVMAYNPILFGALIAGGVVVSVNPLYTARELAHQLRDSGARILFVLENFAHTVEEARGGLGLECIVLVKPGDLLGMKGVMVNFVSRHVKKAVATFSIPDAVALSEVLSEGGDAPPVPVVLGSQDLAFLQYTGGTTGVAKAAELTHRNVGANVEQLAAWLLPHVGERADHVMVTALPLYHIFALTVCAMLMTRLGGCQLLIANPRDLPAFVKTLASRRFTLMAGVNTLYNALANRSDLAKVDFSHVSLCVAGGMAVQASVAARWKERTGHPIIEGYGLSETSPLLCANRLDLKIFSGTVGFPVPSTDISIRDLDGEPVAQGQPGELCARGPQVMRGYWGRADETAKVMTTDGFFRTGDIATLQPDGQVKIVDRIKDMVLVSGFNVYPNEVEDVLAAHPGVVEAAVIGLPDKSSGEAVAAFVVRRDASLSEADLRAWCRGRLTGYKVPRRIEFCDSLPKSNVGKVLRRVLRDQALQQAAPEAAARIAEA
jgi:long-chain acyl-CoA synthetase